MSMAARLRRLVVAAGAAVGFFGLQIAPASAQLFWDWGGGNLVGGSGREVVRFDPHFSKGKIIVSFGDRRLYYITRPGEAVSYPIAIVIVALLMAYVGMVYGPIGAFLAEFFPARIRYTSVSVPYHIGNGWGGGLVPFITTAAYQATGSLGYALIYPIAVPAICFVLSLFLMPETRKMSIWEPGAAKA